MKTLTLAALAALGLCSLPGCFTLTNAAMWNQVKVEPQEVSTPVDVVGLSARWKTEALLEVAVIYADGATRGARWDTERDQVQWTEATWPEAGQVHARVVRGRLPSPNAGGLVLAESRLLLHQAGQPEPVARLDLSRFTQRRAEKPTSEQRLAHAGRVLLHAVALPVAVALDAVTWPVQVAGFLIYVKAGGSLLSLG